MNDVNDDDAPPQVSILEALVTMVFDHTPPRLLRLVIDEVPDHVFRVAAGAHEVLVRASDVVLTHATRAAQFARRPTDRARHRPEKDVTLPSFGSSDAIAVGTPRPPIRERRLGDHA